MKLVYEVKQVECEDGKPGLSCVFSVDGDPSELDSALLKYVPWTVAGHINAGKVSDALGLTDAPLPMTDRELDLIKLAADIASA